MNNTLIWNLNLHFLHTCRLISVNNSEKLCDNFITSPHVVKNDLFLWGNLKKKYISFIISEYIIFKHFRHEFQLAAEEYGWFWTTPFGWCMTVWSKRNSTISSWNKITKWCQQKYSFLLLFLLPFHGCHIMKLSAE